jgi:Recombination endonuclease VII
MPKGIYNRKESWHPWNYGTGNARLEEIKCLSCGITKNKDSFYFASLGNRNYTCKSCLAVKTKIYKDNNKDKIRAYNLKYHYDLNEVQYNSLLEKQNGKCAICKEVKKNFCVDHSHITGIVRGLLCVNCNTAIGMLKDNENIALNAVNYLKENSYAF